MKSTLLKFPNLTTPQVLNVNNPVQAAGAARGRENRCQYRNSVGVQPLHASCCAPTEHSLVRCVVSPRAAATALHGVIHIARLRRAVVGKLVRDFSLATLARNDKLLTSGSRRKTRRQEKLPIWLVLAPPRFSPV